MTTGQSGGLIASVVCLVGLVEMLRAERAGSIRRRYLWKPIASLGFVAVPLCTGALTQDHQPAAELAGWITLGLVLGAVGDVALMFENDRAFIAGLVAFLLGHLAYVVGFTLLVPTSGWYGGAMTGVAIAAVIGAGAVLGYLWPRLGSLKIPVIGYVGVITTMLIGGVAVSMRGRGLPADHRALLTAGAVVFFLSDLAVARERFVARSLWNRMIGLPAYYGAQLMLAWSVSP